MYFQCFDRQFLANSYAWNWAIVSFFPLIFLYFSSNIPFLSNILIFFLSNSCAWIWEFFPSSSNILNFLLFPLIFHPNDNHCDQRFIQGLSISACNWDEMLSNFLLQPYPEIYRPGIVSSFTDKEILKKLPKTLYLGCDHPTERSSPGSYTPSIQSG